MHRAPQHAAHVAEYIANMSAELAKMAGDARLTTLNYFLDMARADRNPQVYTAENLRNSQPAQTDEVTAAACQPNLTIPTPAKSHAFRASADSRPRQFIYRHWRRTEQSDQARLRTIALMRLRMIGTGIVNKASRRRRDIRQIEFVP